MDEPDPSWPFAVAAVAIWAAMWVSIELVLFDGDVLGAGLTGAFLGATFVAFYAVLRRAREQ